MATKFVTLAEAAVQLGMTSDEVNEIRQRGDLYGYRDGTSWKFKPEDVAKVAAQRASGGDDLPDVYVGDSHEISDVPLDLPIDPDEDDLDDVVLLSEFELGESGPSASQTVIGRPGSLSGIDSDVKLASAFDPEDLEASSTSIGTPGLNRPGESTVRLDTSNVDDAGASATFIGSPGEPLAPEESSIQLRGGNLEFESPSSTVIGKPGQPIPPGESDIKLSAFEDFDLGAAPVAKKPGGSDVKAPPAPGGSTVLFGEPPPADAVVDSGISLADEYSDDDFVLGGPGSDITISPGDSGISLVDPSDSGLSLDAPIELKPDTGEASFEISESGEDLSGVTEFDSDEVMELKTSDEFLLTPMTQEGDESSEDSGSQVIALDSESPFESADSSMFASAEGGMSTMLEEDMAVGSGTLSEGGLGGASPAFAGAAGPVTVFAAESPYPAWVVVLMFFCIVFLALCGMMMYDLVRNMWSWTAPYSVNSTIMDTILGLFG